MNKEDLEEGKKFLDDLEKEGLDLDILFNRDVSETLLLKAMVYLYKKLRNKREKSILGEIFDD